MASMVGTAFGTSDSTARVVLRALWVARVPIASILAAFLILSQAEALDLFVDIPPDPLQRVGHWLLFYVAAILFWVLPAHFSARVALQLNHERIGVDTPRRYLALVIGLPRLLSVLCLFAILYGFLQASNHVPSVAGESLANDARRHLLFASGWALALCVIVMLAYAWLSRMSMLQRSRLRPIAPRLYDGLDGVITWCRPRRRRVSEPLFGEELAAAQYNTLLSVFLLLVSIFAIDALLAILFLSPTIARWIPAAQTYLPRAVFVPVLLGINVPGLTLIGILSHRFRLPLILLFFVLLATWGLFREKRHDVRMMEEKIPVRRISLEQAIRSWKAANGCEAPGSRCPRPIIVAGSGGASRAAFMTANTLSYLQEQYPNFSKRVFAISTVSGSSLGAAAFLAALGRQDVPLPADTCSDRRFQGWFACHKSEKEARDRLATTKLQKRVQLFLSSDFLTPVFVTLTFSDMWRIGRDRAAKLELSWDAAWRGVTNDASRSGDFEKPLSDFLPTSAETWRPLLLFNGTSVATGRRIIVSSLTPTHDGKRIFTDAYDFYEMACPGEGRALRGCELRLSTAVTMSARFPLVSPVGIIASKVGIVDRVVDGGYFENSGAQTALELARELKGTHQELHPFILQITNDPSAFDYQGCQQKISWEKQYQQEQPKLPSESEEPNLLRWAFDPLNTVLATRTARGNHATAEALATVEAGGYAHIRVCPQRLEPSGAQGYLTSATRHLQGLLEWSGVVRKHVGGRRRDAFKALSASWWLSAPVQQYLHQQLLAPQNHDEIERIRRALDAR